MEEYAQPRDIPETSLCLGRDLSTANINTESTAIINGAEPRVSLGIILPLTQSQQH